ncbi:MAG: hypothetical protein LBP23_00650 [Treponema sp.]|jgi:hypothetical protein|nr:hypothetical protein [Treponema sp.]
MNNTELSELAGCYGVSLDDIAEDGAAVHSMKSVFYGDSPEKRRLLLAALIMFSRRHPPVTEKYLRLLNQSPSSGFIEENKIRILGALKYSMEFRSKLHNLFGLIVQDIIKQYVIFSKDYRKKNQAEDEQDQSPEEHEYLRQAAMPAGADPFPYNVPIKIKADPGKGIAGGALELFYERAQNRISFLFAFDDVKEAPYDLQVHFCGKNHRETQYAYLTGLSFNNRHIIEARGIFGIIDYSRAQGITIQRIDGIRKFDGEFAGQE